MTPLSSLAFSLVLAAAKPAPAAAPPPPDAVQLYDEGRYAEACEVLRKLDAAAITGPQLYRLFFCEKASGNDAASLEALKRAQETLEKENTAATPLEMPFYLANTYTNLGRIADARRVAEAATRSLEAGTRKKPTALIDTFQVGKLYQDQGRTDEAVTWYKQAIDAFDPKSKRYAGSIRWALRYTAAAASARRDFASAEGALAKLTGFPDAEAADWNDLAIARARQKKYGPASDAWRAAVQADREQADDARYSSRVALVVSQLPSLPAIGAEGKAFEKMTNAELEGALKAEADAVRDVHGREVAAMKPGDAGAPTAALDPKLRESLDSELGAIKARFFAAALEYALRRAPIRETAFREGYAVLIFQDREWELASDPE
jgi:tetratricopeptide (TPR) repeat protein